MYAIITSILIHLLLIMPIGAKNTKNTKSYSLKITNIEFVPSKVETMEEPVIQQGFHGKKKKVGTRKKIVNKKKDLTGDKQALKYFRSVREKIIENFTPSSKAKKLKLNGKVLAKIQIQKSGYYDILYIGGDHKELENMANATFEKIKSFPPIPSELEQSEIQLKIPLHYNLSK